jgi:hypothetical protein
MRTSRRLRGDPFPSPDCNNLLTATGPSVGAHSGRSPSGSTCIDRRKVVGILLSVTGAIVIITAGYDLRAGANRLGDFLVLGCVGSWITYTLLARKAVSYVPSITATGYSTLIGSAALFLLGAPRLSAAKNRLDALADMAVGGDHGRAGGGAGV